MSEKTVHLSLRVPKSVYDFYLQRARDKNRTEPNISAEFNEALDFYVFEKRDLVDTFYSAARAVKRAIQRDDNEKIIFVNKDE